MKKLLAILVFFLCTTGLLAQNSRSAAGEQELMTAMDGLKDALLKKDSVRLSQLLSDDVTYGHSNGWIQTKEEVIRSIVSRQQDYKKIDVTDVILRLMGNTAVINAATDVELEMDGKPMQIDMDVLLVWAKKQGRWQLIARQSVKNMQ
jgi:ketosteroid isomerase-like protein